MSVSRIEVADGTTHVGLDRVDRGEELRGRPLGVGGGALRATGVVVVVVVVIVVGGNARKRGSVRLRIVVVRWSRVAVQVLGLTGIRCSDFRNSRKMGIIRVHRVSVRRSRNRGHAAGELMVMKHSGARETHTQGGGYH